ncbi:hypothetical protein RB199_37180 [Streptomyces libani]
MGAIAPSGPRLGRALTRYVIPSPGSARTVLEVGPGTGAVTRHIAGSLGRLDTLDLVEANPRFVDLLQGAYGGDPRLRFRTGLVQDHDLGTYDTIVLRSAVRQLRRTDDRGHLRPAARGPEARRHPVLLRLCGRGEDAPHVHRASGP